MDESSAEGEVQGKQPSGERMHTVSRFILARFAEPRTSKGMLWSFDLSTGTYRRSTPRNLSVKRNFYRLDEPGEDHPDIVDNALRENESLVAPILQRIEAERRFPTEEELAEVLWFIAVQSARTEGFRSRFTQAIEWMENTTLDFYLSSREHWEYRLAEQGKPVPDALSYERVRRMRDEGRLNLRVRRDFAVLSIADAADRAFEALKDLRWTMLVPDASLGSFVSCDSPVRASPRPLDREGLQQWSVAFSSQLAFVGKPEGREGVLVTRRGHVAEINSWTILNADRFVYSAKQEMLCNADRLRPFLRHAPVVVHATQSDPE